MSLVSLQSDIVERRTENKARVIYEDYTHFAERDRRLSPKGEELAEIAASLDMTREKLIALRQWARQTTKRCKERLAQEMTVLYTLNEPRDRVLNAQYVTKGEAAEIAGVVAPVELLDLDCMYGGLLVRQRYIFVSDLAFHQGLEKYGSVGLLNGLIADRAAA